MRAANLRRLLLSLALLSLLPLAACPGGSNNDETPAGESHGAPSATAPGN